MAYPIGGESDTLPVESNDPGEQPLSDGTVRSPRSLGGQSNTQPAEPTRAMLLFADRVTTP